MAKQQVTRNGQTSSTSKGGVKQANKNSKNEELKKLFPSQMESGKPFVFAIEEGRKKTDKSGEEYLMMYFVQKRTVEGGEVDEITRELLGWNGTERYLRTLRRVLVSVLEDKEIADKYAIGVLHEDKSIFIREYSSPRYDEHAPKMIPDADDEMNDEFFIHLDDTNGFTFVYEEAVLKSHFKADGTANPDAKDVRLKADRKTREDVMLMIENDQIEDIFGI